VRKTKPFPSALFPAFAGPRQHVLQADILQMEIGTVAQTPMPVTAATILSNEGSSKSRTVTFLIPSFVCFFMVFPFVVRPEAQPHFRSSPPSL
jgi:hypothetical protein